jgi:hypothetical protein
MVLILMPEKDYHHATDLSHWFGHYHISALLATCVRWFIPRMHTIRHIQRRETGMARDTPKA